MVRLAPDSHPPSLVKELLVFRRMHGFRNTHHIPKLPLLLGVATWARSGQWDKKIVTCNSLKAALECWNGGAKTRVPAATSGHEVTSDYGAIPKIASWWNKTEGLWPRKLPAYSELVMSWCLTRKKRLTDLCLCYFEFSVTHTPTYRNGSLLRKGIRVKWEHLSRQRSQTKGLALFLHTASNSNICWNE